MKNGICDISILERTDSLTLGIVWRIVWSMGTKCSSSNTAIAFAAEKPPVATTELTVGTVGFVVATVELLLAEALRLWL